MITYTSRQQSNNTVQFLVGNTYRQIPVSEANLDRTGQHSKIHDWSLYVDVVVNNKAGSNNVDIIERVVFDLGPSFEQQTYICCSPIPITLPASGGGLPGWRFYTRQQSYGTVDAKISIRGVGGTKMTVSHEIDLSPALTTTAKGEEKKRTWQTFTESRGVVPLKMLKMDDDQRIGIELELSSASVLDRMAIAKCLPRSAGNHIVIDNYHQCHEVYSDGWKIVPDSSLVCGRNMPDCNRFELVSRVLQGGPGLSEVSAVTRALNTVGKLVQVNKSMGFHVHVDVSKHGLPELIKICQNFIKYEDVMDSFMPPSRRSGSIECDTYFRSNRVGVYGFSNKERHMELASCVSIKDLADTMNGKKRYHKLNLQNLVSKRQPTLEFRQHSATLNYEKISAWVRFCVAFVNNSARLRTPTPFQEGRDLDFQFQALFNYVIKDRALRDFYKSRMNQVAKDEDVGSACCEGCAHGGSCATKGIRTIHTGLAITRPHF